MKHDVSPAVPRATGVAGRLKSIAASVQIDQTRVPARPSIPRPPAAPVHVPRASGVAALLPRPPKTLRPPPPKTALPRPPHAPHRVGLAGRIPPLRRRVMLTKRPGG